MSKERLVELINKAKEEYANDVTDHTETDYIVECLLNEGVIVPPCKINDEVWFIENKGYSKARISHGYVIRFDVRYMYGLGLTRNLAIQPIDTLEDRLYFFMFEWVGDAVFLTREEAEKEFEERESV